MGFRELVRETSGLARIVDQLAKEHAQTRGMTNHLLAILQRSFWGRFRWLFRGK